MDDESSSSEDDEGSMSDESSEDDDDDTDKDYEMSNGDDPANDVSLDSEDENFASTLAA